LAALVKRATVIAFAALLLLLAGSALDALAGDLTIPIPGLAGSGIEVAGALRTDDGGAVVAARIVERGGSSRGRILSARLLADGDVDLAYGHEGLSTLHLNPRLEPTALAIDPATGDAWIGARVGQTGAGEIVALDGRGALRKGFGAAGVLALPAADDGGPVALAWRPGALLIAAGESPCRGCSLSLRDPRTGAVTAAATLPASDLSPPGCSGTAVTSAVFASAVSELVATRTAGGSGCTASVLALGPKLAPTAPAGPPPTLADPDASSILLSSSGSGSCLAGTDPARILIAAYAGASARTAAVAPAGMLISLVSLGPGACGALIKAAGAPARVAQMSTGDRRAVVDRLPDAIAPLAMFRCHQHLLVIGSTPSAGWRAAVIAPVPVRRGEFAVRASATALAASSTGCH
jgi:hypothetical protein